MKPVDLLGVQLDVTSGEYVVLLRESDEPRRVLPLFVGGPEASAIALGATGAVPERPHTHDVMAALVEQLGAQIERVEVTNLDEGVFHADLVVSGPEGASRIDARPSDAIALAVRTEARLLVSEAVLDEAAVEVTEAGADPDVIDAEVDEFRDFLADVDPADFVRQGGPPELPAAEAATDDIDGDSAD